MILDHLNSDPKDWSEVIDLKISLLVIIDLLIKENEKKKNIPEEQINLFKDIYNGKKKVDALLEGLEESTKIMDDEIKKTFFRDDIVSNYLNFLSTEAIKRTLKKVYNKGDFFIQTALNEKNNCALWEYFHMMMLSCIIQGFHFGSSFSLSKKERADFLKDTILKRVNAPKYALDCKYEDTREHKPKFLEDGLKKLQGLVEEKEKSPSKKGKYWKHHQFMREAGFAYEDIKNLRIDYPDFKKAWIDELNKAFREWLKESGRAHLIQGRHTTKK